MQYPVWVKDRPSTENLQEFEAVKLFVESARRARPDFELRPGDYDPVVRL